MKRLITFLSLLVFMLSIQAQTNPAITAWLQNTTETGTYYTEGNSTTIGTTTLVNCQQIEYTDTYAFITTTGVPAYPVGPFLDNNPSTNAEDQEAIFKMPLTPTQNTTGIEQATTGGRIGVFINGVSLFDYQDGVSWNTATNAACGGPGNPACSGTKYWNRDAVVAEREGFDCSKGHPAGGNYHHHQNPSAFKSDIVVLSTICNTYDADGLYTISNSAHSPLIGFTYDGFPIYGAYGYKNTNGTGGIERIKSGYQLRNITVRSTHADGTDVDDGPPVNTTYPLGYYREDYEWVSHAGEDYLDEHNGRICVTPEYPGGTYAYFATVDADWNSAYPYVVGPTFYGTYANRKINSIMNPNTIIYMAPVLPVELLDFSAEKAKNSIQLSWVTATEIDNDYFTLERSSDGDNFNEIAVIRAAGNSNEESFYSYDDRGYPEGKIYYRLRQTDYNGSFSYSRIIGLQIENSVDDIAIFPNPSSEFIVIQMTGLVSSTIKIQLYDLQGKLLRTAQILPGSTISYLDTETLYSGNYLVKIVDGMQTSTHKIVVMH